MHIDAKTRINKIQQQYIKKTLHLDLMGFSLGIQGLGSKSAKPQACITSTKGRMKNHIIISTDAQKVVG